MKYIFVAGAPGSKWSSVVKNIYWSPSLDQSDFTEDRTYWHDASGEYQLMHLGAYWDPGMEFGDKFNQLSRTPPEIAEKEFRRPFRKAKGTKIVKSHVFCHHLNYLKEEFPDCPVVVVSRDDDACLGWWVKCGHFDITYPSYDQYYVDLKHMAKHIQKQNADARQFLDKNPGKAVATNHELCRALGIQLPSTEYAQDYHKSDIEVYVV